MRRWLHACLLVAAAAWTAVVAAAAGPDPGQRVLRLRVDGAIGAASAEHVHRGLALAAERRALLVVIELDTPGGLDSAMRAIIKDILASPVPVATWVTPAGSRAASAGTYILYASHVAAMAPATTLGAATPVAIGVLPAGGETPASGAAAGTLEHKRVNDAAATMRALATLRGRNAEWGERAVREAVSLSAAEALEQHVVDLVAADLADLLKRLDGRVVTTTGETRVTLATAGAAVEDFEPDWRSRLLAVVGDPGLALILVMIGFYGLLFEFANPGFVLPGVVGAVCLLLGLYGLQTLPLSGAGVALLLLGIGFFVAEAFVPSYGALGLGGVVAFTLGALMLVDSGAPGFGVPRAWIFTLALVSLGFVAGLAALVARTRRRPPAIGTATLVGATAQVVEASGAQGWAELQGERWQVRSRAPLAAGTRVRVIGVEGLTLIVEGA